MKSKGRKLFGISVDMNAGGGEEGEPLDTGPVVRAEGIQRLQVGVFGIAAMLLLVGLASVIGDQADLADQAAVPDAAPTTEPRLQGTGTDPLAGVGVVPDIPAEPSPAPLLDPLVLPPSNASPDPSPSATPQP